MSLIAVEAAITIADPSTARALIARSAPIQQATRDDEPGCLVYCFAADPCRDDLIQVYELWESEAALAAHFEHRNYHDMRAMLGRSRPRRRGEPQAPHRRECAGVRRRPHAHRIVRLRASHGANSSRIHRMVNSRDLRPCPCGRRRCDRRDHARSPGVTNAPTTTRTERCHLRRTRRRVRRRDRPRRHPRHVHRRRSLGEWRAPPR